jgi:Tol biopolymer transport system component
MLGVIDADGNLSIYDANGKNPFVVTKDAKAGVKTYAWPTWSTDGRLAFFGSSQDPQDPFSLKVFVLDKVTSGATPKTAYTSTDEVYTYSYWSPGDCPVGNCRDLALLFTPPTQDGNLALRLIRDKNGAFSNKVVGTAAPFYYSFSPDGKQMLWFQKTSEFGIYDVAANKVTRTLNDTPGQFQAPMWSPVDDRMLFGTAGSTPDSTNIVIANGTQRQILLENRSSPISFAWSPDAKMVASVSAFDKVVVTDVKTGKLVASTAIGNVVAYFWSPKSDRVAYIAVTQETPGTSALIRGNGHAATTQAATAMLQWNVLNVTTGQEDTLAKYLPSQDMIYLLNFFDQFSRSHSLWSPDGRYLVYGALDSAGSPEVMLVDTTTPTASPIKVSSGTIGIWSWH